MRDQYRYKIIIDPVHGDIGLSELETKLIDTPTFQRLRKIKQLAFASMVYPNASYSRFAHSIGVLHVASRVIDAFQRNGHLQDDKDVERLRIAALLHDIGHYPYSHLMEYIDWDRYVSKYLTKKNVREKDTTASVDPYPKHAKLARLVITQRKDIREILRDPKYDIDPDEIAAIIEGQHTILPNILHKSLDVDRIDYLLRDSLNTGVPYGQVDINYILNNLDVTENKEIVLNAKARISAEHLLLSRYFMFNAVYQHKTVFGFEEVVRTIILLLLKENRIYKSGIDIKQIVPTNKFLDFHDGYLDKLIDEYAARDGDELLTILCKVIKLRYPPKLIHEVVDLCPLQSGSASEEYILFNRCMEKELEQIASKCQIDPQYLIWRETKDVEFEASNPFTSISRARDTREEEMRELVRIKERSGSITNLIEDKKSIIHHLSQLTLKVSRLYAVGVDKEKVKEVRAEVKARL